MMKLRGLLCLVVAPLISSCAATVDYYSYSYKPPRANEPQATISFMANKVTGDFSLRHVGEDDCDMGSTRLFSGSTTTETINAEKMVFFSHDFSGPRDYMTQYVCSVDYAFVPKAKGVYEIVGEMFGKDYCISKIYEVKNSERIAVVTKKILYTKAGLTACRKMHAG